MSRKLYPPAGICPICGQIDSDYEHRDEDGYRTRCPNLNIEREPYDVRLRVLP